MLLGSIVIVIGYLLGSIPSAYIITRLRKGVDIREVGVKNVGAANVFREIGFWEGLTTLLIDLAKGAVAILIARALGASELWSLGAGFAAVLGHNFPIFLRFRGGKGSATAIGIFLLLAPKEMGIAFVIMTIPFFITRNAPFILLVGFISIPLLIWLFQNTAMLTFYSLALIIFITLRSLPTSKEGWAELVKKENIIRRDGKGI